MDKLPVFPASIPQRIQATTTNVMSVVIARKRMLLFLAVPFVVLVLLFSGASDTELSHKIGTGLKNGVNYVTGDSGPGSNGGIVYISSNSSNSSIGHGTTKYWKSKAYLRPGYETSLADAMPLRIMALGASTTRGDSTEKGIDNNGFRRPIRDRLTAIGNPVNFVGSQRIGNMTDNDIEAYPGVPTHRILEHAKKTIPSRKPNLYLINAGSNDCFQHIDIDNFYKRYDELVRYCLAASPRATAIIATLLPTWDKRFNGREEVWKVNPQIRRLAQIYKEEGLPVVLADLQGPDGVQDGNIASDGMHPGTAGYEMMATKMYDAIVEADALGFLQSPETVMGILDDGNDERKEDAAMKFEKIMAVQNSTEVYEAAQIEMMKAGLAEFKAAQADKKKEKAKTEKPSTKQSRRDRREHRFPQLKIETV